MNYDHKNSIRIADLNMINKRQVAKGSGSRPGGLNIRNGRSRVLLMCFRLQKDLPRRMTETFHLPQPSGTFVLPLF